MTLLAWLIMVAISAALVGGYRQLALTRGWFDIPNQRSSHTAIVPRGAGVVHATIILLVAITSPLWMGGRWWIAVSLAPGFAVAFIGWLDDIRGVSARSRFLIYAAACWGAVSIIFLNDGTDHRALVLILLIAGSGFALLWLVNLYNFMDGINGIAATEGIFVSMAALWLGRNDFEPGLAVLLLAIAATLFGFLPWNFPRAKVFMGDAGSAFLGFVLGTLALWSVVRGSINVWQWLILGGVFIVDASYTLLVRMATGQRWHDAHRSHAYQRLTDCTGSHARAVLVLLLVNVAWLLPLAWWARDSSSPLFCVWLAYMPLLAGGLILKAGKILPSEKIVSLNHKMEMKNE